MESAKLMTYVASYYPNVIKLKISCYIFSKSSSRKDAKAQRKQF
jgi:hypothetical protein